MMIIKRLREVFRNQTEPVTPEMMSEIRNLRLDAADTVEALAEIIVEMRRKMVTTDESGR